MSHRLGRALLLCLSAVLLGTGFPAAGETQPLIDPAAPQGGWSFDNGQEFPGAKGGLELSPDGGRDGGPALILCGDFTGGGGYVQASRILKKPISLRELDVWLRFPDATALTVRLVDSGGTCHQINFRLTPSPAWQRVSFPVADFFAGMSESRAAGRVAKYEHWGKNRDAGWSGELASIHFLLGKTAGTTPVLSLGTILAKTGRPVSSPSETAEIEQTVPLDEILQEGEIDWTFDNGQEFKGATGTLTLVKDQPEAGQNALRLAGDFTGGGAYVQAMRKLDDLAGMTLKRLILAVRTADCPSITLRLVDGTGQCHQRKGFTLTADGTWHDVPIRPEAIAGGEHWGGANDGRFHPPAKLVALILPAAENTTRRSLEFGRIRAAVSAAAKVEAATFREGFESADCLATWKTEGSVSRTTEQPFEGKGLLQLTRTEARINAPVRAVGPAFAAREGSWDIKGVGRAALYSPDDSYQGAVSVDWLAADGHVLAKGVALELRGKSIWKPFRKTLQAPAGTVSACFRVEQLKTYGTFAVDNLSAAYLQVAPAASQKIQRVVLSPASLGGMFLPEASPAYTVAVWSSKPLTPEELTATVTLSDYWDAEVSTGMRVALARTGYKNQVFQYAGAFTLPADSLDVGPFYRLSLDVPVRGAKPFRQSIGVARLPEAATRKLPPESIPFTIRNWDSRIKDYFFLADRIGFRQLGIWGGWDNKPPYKAHAPGIDHCATLGMKWITGTPVAQVELGKDEWADPDMLRAGMTNFLKAYAEKGLAAIAMGNEPHGGPEHIAKNVAAYKVIYETVKAFDPSIKVLATSVEPNEEYFRQGYYAYCDAYDFHTYESYPGIRKTIAEYQKLMRTYNAVKPIVSTELGLNCQGLSRLIVAQEIIKKFAVFFASGGVSASWFTIMYPDRDGTAANSSGQAFNVFDCRYNQYTPKFDAVTLYHAINAFADKTFREEHAYPDGTQAFLFANAAGDCLQVVWNDQTRTDVGLPLPGHDGQATLVMMDGTTVPLKPAGDSVAVTACAAPVLVLYRAGKPALTARLAPASVMLAAPVSAYVKGGKQSFELKGPGLEAKALRVAAPPRWTVTCRDTGSGCVTCDVTPPKTTDAQLGRLVISRLSGGSACGALAVELPLVSCFEAVLSPVPALSGTPPAIEIRLDNHEREPATLHWQAEIEEQFGMDKGSFHLTAPDPVTAGFAEVSDGEVEVPPGKPVSLRLPLRDIDPQTIYRVTVRVSDDLGHEIRVSRLVAGFAAVRRGTPMIDGDLSDAVWDKAAALSVNEARQFFGLSRGVWQGPQDLSASVRFLWDPTTFYLAATVTDDVFVGTKCDGSLWNQDGLQFLADPLRSGGEKMGYYDCSLGLGTKGPQVCFHSTASPDVPTGPVGDARLAVKRGANGQATYELAIPWSRLAPFTPKLGADFGLGLIFNDDDGKGRNFMGWFSGAHLKETDMVGDLILTD